MTQSIPLKLNHYYEQPHALGDVNSDGVQLQGMAVQGWVWDPNTPPAVRMLYRAARVCKPVCDGLRFIAQLIATGIRGIAGAVLLRWHSLTGRTNNQNLQGVELGNVATDPGYTALETDPPEHNPFQG
jgi:hypothetical protein